MSHVRKHRRHHYKNVLKMGRAAKAPLNTILIINRSMYSSTVRLFSAPAEIFLMNGL